MSYPDLRGRRVKATILYDVAGWRIRKAAPILYKVGIREDGTAGRVRAEPGWFECICVDPNDGVHTVTCLLRLDQVATARVELRKRTVVNLNRFGEEDK